MRGAAGGAAGGAARGARRGGDGPRAAGAGRAAASACAGRGDATEKNKKANAARHDETHQTRRAPETARALTAGRGGHGPPWCLDNCANNSCAAAVNTTGTGGK